MPGIVLGTLHTLISMQDRPSVLTDSLTIPAPTFVVMALSLLRMYKELLGTGLLNIRTTEYTRLRMSRASGERCRSSALSCSLQSLAVAQVLVLHDYITKRNVYFSRPFFHAMTLLLDGWYQNPSWKN